MGYVMLGIRPNNQLALQLGAKVDARGLVITDANGELRFRIYLSLEICGQTNLSAWQHAVDCKQVINKYLKQ
jgi:hypothetical protein